MFVNSGWVDITTSVYWRDRIQVRRGLTSESSKTAPPSECTFTVNNRTGNFSPRNPLGAYYGSIGQNTPVRVAIRVAKDAFGRTISNGLGTADVGGAWTLAGAASHFSTDGSVAKITFTAANDSAYAYQAGQVYRDVDVAATFTWPFSNVTGGVVEASLLAGGLSTTDHFAAQLIVSTAEVMTIGIVQLSSGLVIAAAVTVSSFSFTGQAIRMRFQQDGQTLRAKVWPAASTEPNSWHVEGNMSAASDTLIDRAAGWVGFRAVAGASNSNVTFALSVDDWEVRVNQFHGEASAWPSQWDISGKDIYVPVTASGLRRRLSQGSAPLPSSYYRANLGLTPAALFYYPVEDESGATSIASAIPGVGPMTLTGPGTAQLASDSSFVGSAPIGKPHNSRWTSPVISSTATGFAHLIFLLSTPVGGEVDGITLAQVELTGTLGGFTVFYETAVGGSLVISFFDQNRNFIADSVGDIATAVNGTPMQVDVKLTQNGANIDWTGGSLIPGAHSGTGFSGTLAGRTIGSVRQVYGSPYTEVANSAIGHISVRNFLASASTFSDQLAGWPAELAQTRIARLCSENDSIANSYIRSTINDGTQLGVQGRKKLLDLLDEAIRADLGALNESASTVGFVHRYGRSLYNQDAALTLDWSTGKIAEAKQSDDDQLLINDYTASRDSGSSYRATQDTGRLAVTAPSSGTGAGRYNSEDSYNVYADTQLTDIATWIVHVGTLDETRYPRITANLAKLANSSTQLFLDALSVNLYDRIELTNPKALVTNGTVSQLAVGYSATFGGKEHEISWVCRPADAYTVPEVAADSGDTNQWLFRADTDGSTVNTLANAAATSLSVATPSGPLWTTVADDFPLYLDVGGIRVRATACSGASSPQTFTVDALAYSRAAGLSVSVWHLPTLAQ